MTGISKLLGLAGDGGEDLDESSVALSVGEFVHLVDSLLQVLLDQGKSLLVESDLSVSVGLLEEGSLAQESLE